MRTCIRGKRHRIVYRSSRSGFDRAAINISHQNRRPCDNDLIIRGIPMTGSATDHIHIHPAATDDHHVADRIPLIGITAHHLPADYPVLHRHTIALHDAITVREAAEKGRHGFTAGHHDMIVDGITIVGLPTHHESAHITVAGHRNPVMTHIPLNANISTICLTDMGTHNRQAVVLHRTVLCIASVCIPRDFAPHINIIAARHNDIAIIPIPGHIAMPAIIDPGIDIFPISANQLRKHRHTQQRRHEKPPHAFVRPDIHHRTTTRSLVKTLVKHKISNP